MKQIIVASFAVFAAATAIAQSPVSEPTSSSTPVTVTASVRERTNATEWFAATEPAEQYGHQDSLLRLGIGQRVRHFDYQLELGQSSELALPSDAVSAVAAQGQLGLGATYYASNNNNQDPVAASLRQGFLRYHFNDDKDAVRLGRFEFFDGQEMPQKNGTLAWLQANRVAQRLVGNFGFSNGQRSFDGLDGKFGGKGWDVTAMAGRATQGVFNMNANPELNVDIQYLAYTHTLAHDHVAVRAFGLGYHDGRTGLTKTDNRSTAARALDHKNIRIGTYGGDLIAAIPAGHTTFDLLLWGAGQSGSWGLLTQRSGAIAAEGGVRFTSVASQPWFRGGYLRSTGDTDATDNTHGTFFQVLPTPRIYARFPFFNMMNSKDSFVELMDKPSNKLDLRTDLHLLQLTSGSDFWYQGGGAFDNKVFGYTGRPGNNHSSLASLYDISADYTLTSQLALGMYYAHVFGKSVVAAIYPAQHDANYGYLELAYRFQRRIGQTPNP